MKIRRLLSNLNLVLIAFLVMVSMDVASAEVGPADLTGEDKVHFDRFRELFQYGSPDEFYAFASDYEKELKGKGYMMLYFKLKNNEGFFALRHNMIYRAMQVAEDLDSEMRQLGATDYFYLATGLMGDVYHVTHDRNKAEAYFIQAIDEAGDRDPKFTMRCYQSLAEEIGLKEPERALDYMDKSLKLARQTGNVEYESLSLAMTAYVYFLNGQSKDFFQYYDLYQGLRSMDKPGFSHRYDNIMEIGKLAFNGSYDAASQKLGEGRVFVDSSLVAIRIFALERDVDKGFEAMKRRNLEMDSIFSLAQDANYDHMATESSLIKSREEALANKQMVKKLTNWIIGLTVAYLFIYIMGRRRLIKKIWTGKKELEQALKHAEESDRMKSAFISNMSHEIRTPLNAVAGFSELLCQPDIELGEEEKQDMKERIAYNVEAITSIVNELLELSKSESESALRPDSEMEDVWINQLCRSHLRSLAGKTNKGVEMRFATNVADDFKVRTHAGTVKRILTHLLGNAQKFTEQGHIELRCASDSAKHLLNLSVTDTGIGISEEDRERIFEAFEKASGNFKEGIGLGLPISQRLASSIGARITLDPAYTDGSRFVLSIPLL